MKNVTIISLLVLFLIDTEKIQCHIFRYRNVTILLICIFWDIKLRTMIIPNSKT